MADALSPPVLEIHDLHVNFNTFDGSVRAVDGVDISLQKGEILGIVGETGSGKSVLLQAILRLIRLPGEITAGTIRFVGEDLIGKSDEDMRRIRGKDIARIVPNPRSHLNPVQRVGDQIADVVLAHNRISRNGARERARELLVAVGIPDPGIFMQSYPHELSGGMCQRIVIAMALANSPTLLLADEPTAGLDVTTQIQILDLFRDLAQQLGSAALLVTRDLSTVAHYCDRVAVMYAGKIVETAGIHSFFDNGVHPYSRVLLEAAYRARGVLDKMPARRPADAVGPSPEGCPFHPRCAWANDTNCRTVAPALEPFGEDHFVRCHRKGEIAE